MLWVIVGIVVVVIVAGVLIFVGMRSPQASDPLQARLAEFSTRDTPVTLEELELSTPFSERIILPIIRQLGEFAVRFTPQASLASIKHQLEVAGNPPGIEPATFYVSKFLAAGGVFGLVILLASVSPADSALSWSAGVPKILAIAAGGAGLGFYLPTMMISSRATRRQNEIIKSMPDALDLLTVCVEAGLGFDQAMQKVSEKWENELSLAFARVIQEIRLGKIRRDSLRDMAERMDIPDMTSFVAALIQADQLGVSMAKVLRIQSEQMRMRRRQRAEKQAHEAPIKMLIPMAFLIFPSIYIVLLGPAGLMLMNSPALGAVGG